MTSSSQSADARYTLAPCVPCLARGAENITRCDVSVYEVARKASPNAHDARGAAVNALVRGFMATLEPCSVAPAVRVAAPSDGGECEGYAMPLPLPGLHQAGSRRACCNMHTGRTPTCNRQRHLQSISTLIRRRSLSILVDRPPPFWVTAGRHGGEGLETNLHLGKGSAIYAEEGKHVHATLRSLPPPPSLRTFATVRMAELASVSVANDFCSAFVHHVNVGLLLSCVL